MHKFPLLMKPTSSISEAAFDNVAKTLAAALIWAWLVLHRRVLQPRMEELLFGALIHAIFDV